MSIAPLSPTPSAPADDLQAFDPPLNPSGAPTVADVDGSAGASPRAPDATPGLGPQAGCATPTSVAVRSRPVTAQTFLTDFTPEDGLSFAQSFEDLRKKDPDAAAKLVLRLFALAAPHDAAKAMRVMFEIPAVADNDDLRHFLIAQLNAKTCFTLAVAVAVDSLAGPDPDDFKRAHGSTYSLRDPPQYPFMVADLVKASLAHCTPEMTALLADPAFKQQLHDAGIIFGEEHSLSALAETITPSFEVKFDCVRAPQVVDLALRFIKQDPRILDMVDAQVLVDMVGDQHTVKVPPALMRQVLDEIGARVGRKVDVDDIVGTARIIDNTALIGGVGLLILMATPATGPAWPFFLAVACALLVWAMLRLLLPDGGGRAEQFRDKFVGIT